MATDRPATHASENGGHLVHTGGGRTRECTCTDTRDVLGGKGL
jgi:hypothetical protein